MSRDSSLSGEALIVPSVSVTSSLSVVSGRSRQHPAGRSWLLDGDRTSAATVDAQIRQARFDRFLLRVFADGEESEWLLKGGMSMLAREPRARTTKDGSTR